MPAWIIKYFPLVLTGVVWVVTFGVGYWQGFDTCNTKWKVKTEKETGRYLEQINDGVRECPSETASQPLSRKPATSSDVVCYSKTELQQKIERSLVIAKECDELAEKYERLKEVYNVRSR